MEPVTQGPDWSLTVCPARWPDHQVFGSNTTSPTGAARATGMIAVRGKLHPPTHPAVSDHAICAQTVVHAHSLPVVLQCEKKSFFAIPLRQLGRSSSLPTRQRSPSTRHRFTTRVGPFCNAPVPRPQHRHKGLPQTPGLGVTSRTFAPPRATSATVAFYGPGRGIKPGHGVWLRRSFLLEQLQPFERALILMRRSRSATIS
jgi:hypothetical protein